MGLVSAIAGIFGMNLQSGGEDDETDEEDGSNGMSKRKVDKKAAGMQSMMSFFGKK